MGSDFLVLGRGLSEPQSPPPPEAEKAGPELGFLRVLLVKVAG